MFYKGPDLLFYYILLGSMDSFYVCMFVLASVELDWGIPAVCSVSWVGNQTTQMMPEQTKRKLDDSVTNCPQNSSRAQNLNTPTTN